MRCQRIHQHLLAFIEGELRPRMHRTVENHLVHCTACRAEVQGLRQTLHLVHTLDVPEPGPEFWQTFATKLQQRLPRETAAAPQRWYAHLRRLWQVPTPVFAAVAVSLILVSSLPLLYGPRSPQGRSPVGLIGGEETQTVTELDFFQYLDLLEEVEALEHLDAAL